MSEHWTPDANEAVMLPWRAEAIRTAKRDEPVQLFRNRLADRVFRAPWWWPYVSLGPAACLGLGWLALNEGLWTLGIALVGAAAWTLFEYGLHRWIFHAPGTAMPLRYMLFLVHGHHHAWPSDRDRLTATPWQAGLTLLIPYGLAGLVQPPTAQWAFTLGFAVAYVGYEAMHFMAHHLHPRGALLKAIRAHHLRHHHEDPTRRWGISSPVWDGIAGTDGTDPRR